MANHRKTDERENIRERFWATEQAWTGEGRGWGKIPRTLPLLNKLLRSKKLSGRTDPSDTYLALWARHMDNGVIEITNEQELAYESGYTGGRALRSWQERMALLEDLGFIKTKQIGNQRYRFVLLVDPAVTVAALFKKKLVDQDWLDAYEMRRMETKEDQPKGRIVAMPPQTMKNR